MSKIILIGADNPRARSYAAAMGRAGFADIKGIFYGNPEPTLSKNSLEETIINGIWIPPINKNISDFFVGMGWEFTWIEADTINSSQAAIELLNSDAELAIFAGRGGEIVVPFILEQGIPILHLHPGKLPDQRGSTTIYYSILEGKPITVSGLVLSAEIDAGSCVAEKQYAYPPYGIDLDVFFDCAIRSDLLVEVIRCFLNEGKLPDILGGFSSQGRLYYVVHPLLKHIARLSLS